MDGTEIDLLAEPALTNPYPLYAELRRTRPVCPLKGGGYLITRHEDVSAALSDPAFRNAPSRFSVLHPSKADRYEASRIANNLLPFQDPPIHGDNRRRFQAAFSPCARDLAGNLAEMAETAMAEALAAEPGRARDIDLVADFGRPFAIAAMARLLSLDREEAAALAAGADAFFYLFAPVSDAKTFLQTEATLTEARARLREIAARQSRHAPEGFAGRALSDASAGDTTDIERVADTMMLFFADGIENVQYGIGLVWAALMADAKTARLTADDAAALKTAVREAIRLESPAQSIPRIADREMVLHGTTIKSDAPVHLSLGSANRDPDAIPDADRLILTPGGARGRAIPFGAGRHSCIGGSLAVDMITAAVGAVMRRQAVPESAFEALRFAPRFGHRWPTQVRARFG